MKAIVRFIKHIRKTAVTVLAILAIVLPPLLLLVPVAGFVTYVPRGSDYLIDYFWESVAKTTTDKSFSDFAN
jgi:hypothetical protein